MTKGRNVAFPVMSGEIARIAEAHLIPPFRVGMGREDGTQAHLMDRVEGAIYQALFVCDSVLVAPRRAINRRKHISIRGRM
jgi:hypothetical protein